jgi:hypothetical protein
MEAPAPSPTISVVSSVSTVTPVEQTPVDITRLIYMLYQDVEQQISRSDLKAQITLSTSAILAAVMTNLGLGVKTWAFTQMSPLEAVALGAYVLSGVCLCFAIGNALSAAYPRSLGKSATPLADPNLYFSAHLIHLPPAEYSQRFCEQTNHEVKHRVLQQIHAKSRVLEAKLHFVRRGLRMLVGAMAFWALARLLLLAVTGGLEVPGQMLSK